MSNDQRRDLAGMDETGIRAGKFLRGCLFLGDYLFYTNRENTFQADEEDDESDESDESDDADDADESVEADEADELDEDDDFRFLAACWFNAADFDPALSPAFTRFGLVTGATAAAFSAGSG